jgi:precorrin-4/cobalt-precorrin-4 C11-methyltransferase
VKQLIGVGVGPGDPELVTVKAIRALHAADVILVPVLADASSEPGRAETIIREHVPDVIKIKRLEFALNDTGGVTPRRAAAWRKAAAAVADEFGAGATTIAFGTLGDPNLYSTFSYLAQTVRELVPGVSVTTIPGITAMQDLASRSGISLAEGTEPVTLVPLNAGPGVLEAALAGGGAVVGYKVGAAASPAPHTLRDMLRAAGRLEGAVLGARLGLPGELITPAAKALAPAPAAEAPAPDSDIPDIPYLSTLIVPVLRTPGVGSGLQAGGAARGERGLVSFVGAGPGAPDLLTLRGAEVIATADVVIWASSLVHPDVLKHAGKHAQVVDSARMPMEGVLPYYREAAARGLTIARVHSGDPSLWGAIAEQLDQCEALGLDTEVVPGVSSFTAVAARVKRELTIPEVAQSVILTRLGGGKTPMPPGERVAEFARHGTTMALFLSAARSGQLQDELLAGGYPPDTPCVVAYQVTWPDELILQTELRDLASTIRQHKLWKHTLVLVGPGLSTAGTRSHLYHPGHFHGYRKADHQARKQLRATKDSP